MEIIRLSYDQYLKSLKNKTLFQETNKEKISTKEYCENKSCSDDEPKELNFIGYTPNDNIRLTVLYRRNN